MFHKLQQAVNLFKSFLSQDDQDKLSNQTLVSFLDFDQDFISDFFKSTTFEFIEDYDLVKGRKPTVAVGTVRGNFIKTADGWKYHKKEERVKSGHEKETVVPQKKQLNWHKLGDKERKRRIEAAHTRLKEAEAGTEEKHKTEATALRLWLDKHDVKAEKARGIKEDLEKGGSGSGQKGHHTDRKPYPGEEAHNMKVQPFQAPSGMKGPRDIGMSHYTDSPMLKKYRVLIKKLGHEAVEGRFHYDPKSDKIVATDEGKMLAVAAAGMHK